MTVAADRICPAAARVRKGVRWLVEVAMTAPVPPETVFAVLADGWSYAGWVVGASHIRDVDPGWPAPGTRIHHSVGPWPLVARDITTVRAVRRPTTLELDARLWPLGMARIRLELAETERDGTRIRMLERVVSGPGRILPHAVQGVLLVPRNRESLRRLIDLAVGRKAGHAG